MRTITAMCVAMRVNGAHGTKVSPDGLPGGDTVSKRRKELTRQLVVRVDESLFEALEQDARANGRTVAQSVRFKLREQSAVAVAR